MWDLSAGGRVISKKTPQQAMMREVKEELGITIQLQQVRPHVSISFRNGFDDIFLIEQPVECASLRLQKEEVQNVR